MAKVFGGGGTVRIYSGYRRGARRGINRRKAADCSLVNMYAIHRY